MPTFADNVKAAYTKSAGTERARRQNGQRQIQRDMGVFTNTAGRVADDEQVTNDAHRCNGVR